MKLLRKPAEAPPGRMAPLARLPVFFAFEGKRAIVAGGDGAAAWKAELLIAAGAHVHVYAPKLSEEMMALTSSAAPGCLVVVPREWRSDDFAGASIAVGSCADEGEAHRFSEAARSAGVPVNVIDKPAFCDFAFGAIVNRSPLVIGISTDGGAPVFAQAIRAKLEAMIPTGFARWAQAARDWRGVLQSTALSFAGRRRFWQLFTARALKEPNAEPTPADYDALLATVESEGAAAEKGSVTLVGAGPGDPELLTLRAVRALQSADVILVDDLVAPEVLDFARREAKRMLVGKVGQGPSCAQGDINSLMVALARGGKRVVRLKGGDPLIFGRAGEEIAACRAAEIPIEIVPGITAAQGAAARLEAPLTHRREARRLQYITASSEEGAVPDDVNWASIADPSTTSAVYMPRKGLREFCSRGIAAGMDPATAAVAVICATRASEKIVRGNVADIADRLAQAESSGPVLVLIGSTLCQGEPGGDVAAIRNSA